MTAALAMPTEPAPGYVRRLSKTGKLCDFWGGGKVPRHPDAAAAVGATPKPFWGYAWIARMVLDPLEKAVLMALMLRVDSETWRWPKRPGDALRGGPKGVSIAELAAHCSCSERTVQRRLRRLEALGVVIRRDCRPHRNEYQLVAARMEELAAEGKKVVRDLMDRLRERRAAAAMAADAALDAVVGRVAPGPKVAECSAPAAADSDRGEGPDGADGTGALPLWTRTSRAAKSAGAAPDVVGRLVRAAHRAGREPGVWTETGKFLCRPVLREWVGLGRPAPAEWARLLAGLAQADREGRLPRPRTGGKTGALRLLSLVKVPAHREAARAALAAAEARETPVAPVPPTRASGRLDLPWTEVRVGHPPGDPEGWRVQGELVRRQMGPQFDMVLKPLRLDGVDTDGRVRVVAGAAVHAQHVAERFAGQLALMAGGPVRLVW